MSRTVLGSILLCALGVAACSRSAGRLEVLRSDPMATVGLPAALEVKTSELPGSAGPGKPAPAYIARTFTVRDEDVGSAIEQLAELASEAGWSLERRPGGGYTGKKKLDGLFCQILVTGLEDDNVVWIEISTHDS